MRQNALVQHIGIGDNNMPGAANGLAGGYRRITVEGVGFNVNVEDRNQVVQFIVLILGEILGG